MAISFDAGSSGTTTTDTLTISHTTANARKILLFAVKDDNGTTTGVTYNTVPMTQVSVSPVNFQTTKKVYLFYLLNPTAGANNIVASRTGASGAEFIGAAASYNNVRQSDQPDSVNSATGNTNPLSVATTTVADNSWVVIAGGSGQPLTAGSSTTLRAGSGTDCAIGDFNQAKTPAGSVTLAFATGSVLTGEIIVSLKPAIFYTQTFSETQSFSEVKSVAKTPTADTQASTEIQATSVNRKKTNVSKNSASLSDATKHSASPSNSTKRNASPSNQNKSL